MGTGTVILRALLFAAAIAFFSPSLAEAANRYAVCTGTCTWDNSSQAMWSASSGGSVSCGANCTPPGVGDDAIFDASTCVGGTTCTITVNATLTISTLNTGACTASTTGCIIDFAGFGVTISGSSGWNNSGTGTRNITCGSSTFSFTNTGSANAWLGWGTTTNLTLSCASGTFAFSGNSATARTINLGTSATSLTYGTITVAGNTLGGGFFVVHNGTITVNSLTITAPNIASFSAASLAVGTLAFASQSSTALTALLNATAGSAATITTANPVTGSWTALRLMTFAGGSSVAFSDSFDLLRNSTSGGTLSITPPSVGGGGGRIIGG